jgi:hypothetical protein
MMIKGQEGENRMIQGMMMMKESREERRGQKR